MDLLEIRSKERGGQMEVNRGLGYPLVASRQSSHCLVSAPVWMPPPPPKIGILTTLQALVQVDVTAVGLSLPGGWPFTPRISRVNPACRWYVQLQYSVLYQDQCAQTLLEYVRDDRAGWRSGSQVTMTEGESRGRRGQQYEGFTGHLFKMCSPV